MQLQSTPRTLPGFLPDIDGLRAFAVLAVVLFHLQLPGFDGGYVGVDIFFVISGFLITGILQQKVSNGSFRFGEFYSSRVRRLFPAVIATVTATFIASALILQPLEFQGFAKSAAGALLSAANIVFYTEAGYWDADAELKPLLHMWSLGVEEQFYLFWPALLLVLLKFKRQLYLVALTLLLVASLWAAISFTAIDQPAAFYLLPFRVWQFCLGALALALWQHFKLSDFGSQLTRAAGLSACVVAAVHPAAPENFPGWFALLPSVGAALVLFAASPEEPSPWLANKYALWVGKVSYAMYLVHWPPIALTLAWTQAELNPLSQALLAVVTLIGTLVLHYGVEKRFYQRGNHRHSNTKRLVLGSGVVTLLIVGVSVYGWKNPERLAVQEVVYTADVIEQIKKERFSLRKGQCYIIDLENSERCKNLDNAILVLGDSHEVDGANFLNTILANRGGVGVVRFGSTNACGETDLTGAWPTSNQAACNERLQALYESLSKIEWRAVLYSSNLPYRHRVLTRLLIDIKAAQPNVRIALMSRYINTKRPCAQYINRYGSANACRKPENVEIFDPDPSKQNYALYDTIADITDIHVDKIGLLCEDRKLKNCIVETPDGVPMFVDTHHLTLPFADFLARRYIDSGAPDLIEALGLLD